MSVSDTKFDEDIDTELGERYYKDHQALEIKLTNDIIEIIRQFIDRRLEEGRRPAMRDAHAKDNGCVKAVVRIDPDLDPDLRQGVFIPGREYKAWIRFSNGNSEPRNSRWPDGRGMAIKLMGVAGERLLDDEKQTQDFIMINQPAFFIDDLERYKATLHAFHRGGIVAQYLSLLELKGREKYLALKVNAGVITNPLFSQYWSMTPYRLGVDPARKMAVKFTAKPRLPPRDTPLEELRSRARAVATFLAPGFTAKDEMDKILGNGEAWFDLFVQRFVDHRRTPIEDSTKEWKESVAALRHVAKVIIPSQDVISPARDAFCENLSFSPWHGLREHKPLGAVNRVRKTVYLQISEHRHRRNGIPKTEPTGDESV
jgi:hypothetical protein